MNEYLETFQKVIQSVNSVLGSQYSGVESIEVKQSAVELKISVEDCIQELRESAKRLQPFIASCLDDLAYASEVWHSKRRIAETSRSELWQIVGEISGKHVRLTELKAKLQKTYVEKAAQSWQRRFEKLKKKYFLLSNDQIKAGIGWSEKDGFRKDAPLELDSFSSELSFLFKAIIRLIIDEMKTMPIERCKNCLELLDKKKQDEIEARLLPPLSEFNIKNLVESDLKLGDDCVPSLSTNFAHTIESWNSKFGDITFDEFSKFGSRVEVAIERKIKLIIDYYIDLAVQVTDQLLDFYNLLFEKQACYQQETIKQQKAEAVWIEQQYQRLNGIQEGIQTILNQGDTLA